MPVYSFLLVAMCGCYTMVIPYDYSPLNEKQVFTKKAPENGSLKEEHLEFQDYISLSTIFRISFT